MSIALAPAPEDQKNLTPKQIEAALKREAAKASKEQAAAQKKAEAERKKHAKTTTKKAVSLASKVGVPLANACKTGEDLVQKAVGKGLQDEEAVKDYGVILEELKEWKKAASNALAFYTKNPGCELNALPFENDKACNSKIKDLSSAAKEVKKLLSATTKKGASQGGA